MFDALVICLHRKKQEKFKRKSLVHDSGFFHSSWLLPYTRELKALTWLKAHDLDKCNCQARAEKLNQMIISRGEKSVYLR